MKKSILQIGSYIALLAIILPLCFSAYPAYALDPTPRVAFWGGKVNQHVDVNGVWFTDPDGSSGAEVDHLTYCQKWYPNTNTVLPYQIETISTWQNGGNTGGPFTNTVQTYSCSYVPPNTNTDPTPRIAYWSGKVNQHVDLNTLTWTSDPDQTSGSAVPQYGYCRKWYPNTLFVRQYQIETIPTWRTSASFGNMGPYTNTVQTYECVQPVIPPVFKQLNPVNSINVQFNETKGPNNSTYKMEYTYFMDMQVSSGTLYIPTACRVEDSSVGVNSVRNSAVASYACDNVIISGPATITPSGNIKITAGNTARIGVRYVYTFASANGIGAPETSSASGLLNNIRWSGSDNNTYNICNLAQYQCNDFDQIRFFPNITGGGNA